MPEVVHFSGAADDGATVSVVFPVTRENFEGIRHGQLYLVHDDAFTYLKQLDQRIDVFFLVDAGSDNATIRGVYRLVDRPLLDRDEVDGGCFVTVPVRLIEPFGETSEAEFRQLLPELYFNETEFYSNLDLSQHQKLCRLLAGERNGTSPKCGNGTGMTASRMYGDRPPPLPQYDSYYTRQNPRWEGRGRYEMGAWGGPLPSYYESAVDLHRRGTTSDRWRSEGHGNNVSPVSTRMEQDTRPGPSSHRVDTAVQTDEDQRILEQHHENARLTDETSRLRQESNELRSQIMSMEQEVMNIRNLLFNRFHYEAFGTDAESSANQNHGTLESTRHDVLPETSNLMETGHTSPRSAYAMHFSPLTGLNGTRRSPTPTPLADSPGASNPAADTTDSIPQPSSQQHPLSPRYRTDTSLQDAILPGPDGPQRSRFSQYMQQPLSQPTAPYAFEPTVIASSSALNPPTVLHHAPIPTPVTMPQQALLPLPTVSYTMPMNPIVSTITTPPVVPSPSYIAIAGGLPSTKQTIDVFQPETGSWTKLCDIRQMTCISGGATAIGNDIFVLEGAPERGSIQRRLVQKYNIQTQQWDWVTSMPRIREGIVSTTLNETIYLISELHKPLTCVDAYIPRDDRWVSVAPLNQCRYRHMAVSTTDSIYVIGGAGTHSMSATVERFDPREGVWTEVSRMSQPRLLSFGASEGDSIYCLGGSYGGLLNTSNDVEIFELRTRRWRTGPRLNFVRYDGGAAFLGKDLYAAIGFSETQEPRPMERLRCNSDAWETDFADNSVDERFFASLFKIDVSLALDSARGSNHLT